MLKHKLINILFFFCLSLLVACQQKELKKYDWNKEDGYRWSNLTVDSGGQAGFTSLKPNQTGINFTNNLPQEDIFENRHYLNGSGVALGDIDGDGWTDIYFAQLDGPNKLYKNIGGFRFKDVTDSAGVAHKDYFSTGVVFADIDGDEDLDLLVSSMEQENVIYTNDGQGRFARKENGLSPSKGTHTMALADIDNDEDLDLYVTNYKEKSVLDLFDIKNLSWENTVAKNSDQTYTLLSPYDEHYTILYNEDGRPERREIGRKDELFINNGNGNFEKENKPAKRFLDVDGNPKGFKQEWGLAAKFHDINQDGLPDLYVCNDFWNKDRVWMNQGEGVFKEMDPLKIRSMSFAAMGVDFSDVNRDGYWDIFVTEMLSPKREGQLRQFIPDDPHPKIIGQYNNQPQYNRNSFYLNRGDNSFAEVSYFSGVEASGWSWATRFLDVDLDGYEDLLITTGYTYDVQDLDAQEEWRNKIIRSNQSRSFIDTYPPLKEVNKAFRNKNGIIFEEVSSEWGFKEEDISHGLATADFDHDGDLDLVVNRLNQQAGIYENKTSASRIAIRLIGESPNTQAIGAKVELEGGPGIQRDEISAGGDYLSDSDQLIVFAANKENENHKLTITWPGGSKSIIDSIQADRIYEINQQSLPLNKVNNPQKSTKPFFKDVSDKINHEHNEEPYDDFRIQPLLPLKLSKQGPGISWIDFDSDGDDDLFIPSGRGGKMTAYENDGNGKFQQVLRGDFTQQIPADQTAIIGWGEGQEVKLLMGNANYETGDIKTPSVLNHSILNGEITKQENIPGVASTTGVVVAADYEGDGDLDLFVGGRFIPALYPMNATSRLFKNENGLFILDKQNSEILEDIGLVTSGVFTDYDQDGDQDLLMSLEWDTIRLFENRKGLFTDITNSVGLDQYKGWWNGIATGDFNNDGRPDIIATNRGLNSPYQLDSGPLKMFYQDVDRDGRIDIIEAIFEQSRGEYYPRRQLREYDSISDKFSSGISSNKEFATSTLHGILGNEAENVLLSKEVNTLEHMIFFNEGNHYRAHSLPDEAQLSAAFYAGVADFNNDGNEDLFLSQNFFQVRENTPRLDAGRGLWLKGNGDGSFEDVPGKLSGIKIYGEQRGAAMGDFNDDGKVDLAVSQNGAETKLFINDYPRQGLKVQLVGPEDNKYGIGSSLRLVYKDDTKGPRREVQAGSGYWSQNSHMHVLGIDINKIPLQVEITWFDGSIDTIEIRDDQIKYKVVYEY